MNKISKLHSDLKIELDKLVDENKSLKQENKSLKRENNQLTNKVKSQKTTIAHY